MITHKKLDILEEWKQLVFERVYTELLHYRNSDPYYLKFVGLCAIIENVVFYTCNSEKDTIYPKIVRYVYSNLPWYKKLWLFFKTIGNSHKIYTNHFWWGTESFQNNRDYKAWYNPRIKFWVKLAKKNNIELKQE